MPPAEHPCVLITGMSGTGKSTALAGLQRRGYAVHDMDAPGRSFQDNEGNQRWNLVGLVDAIRRNRHAPFFVSGCSEDQAVVRPHFTHVVLLSLPVDTLIGRIATRTSNRFGKTPGELARILQDLEQVEPLIRRNATQEIVTTDGPDAVVCRILRACRLAPPPGRAHLLSWANVCAVCAMDGAEALACMARFAAAV